MRHATRRHTQSLSKSNRSESAGRTRPPLDSMSHIIMDAGCLMVHSPIFGLVQTLLWGTQRRSGKRRASRGVEAEGQFSTTADIGAIARCNSNVSLHMGGGVISGMYCVVLYSRLDGQVPSYLNWCSLPQVERLQVTTSHYGLLAVD